MKFDWHLRPLQRKLEWDLDLARGRLAVLSRRQAQAEAAVRALESSRLAQAAAAATATQRVADPVLHAQAVAWLAGAEGRLARMRARCDLAGAEVAAARAACKDCNARLEALGELRDRAWGRFLYAVRREEAKEADLAWLARKAGEAGEAAS